MSLTITVICDECREPFADGPTDEAARAAAVRTGGFCEPAPRGSDYCAGCAEALIREARAARVRSRYR